jgi:hypothetical protein
MVGINFFSTEPAAALATAPFPTPTASSTAPGIALVSRPVAFVCTLSIPLLTFAEGFQFPLASHIFVDKCQQATADIHLEVHRWQQFRVGP